MGIGLAEIGVVRWKKIPKAMITSAPRSSKRFPFLTALLMLATEGAIGCADPPPTEDPIEAPPTGSGPTVGAPVPSIPSAARRESNLVATPDWGDAVAASKPQPETQGFITAVDVAPDGESFAMVERDVAGGTGHTWLVLRSMRDLSVKRAVPLCLAGKPGARVVSECPGARSPIGHPVRFSPDGKSLLVGCRDCAPSGSSVAVYDTADLSLRFAVALTDDVHRASLGPSLATISTHKETVVLDARTSDVLGGFVGVVTSLSPDATIAIAGGRAATLVDTLTGKEVAKLRLANAPEGALFTDGAVFVSSVSTTKYGLDGKDRGHLWVGGGKPTVSRDGRYVLTSQYEASQGEYIVRVTDMRAASLVIEQTIGKSQPLAATISHTGRFFVVDKLGALVELAPKSHIVDLAVSPDGATVASVESEGDRTSPKWFVRLRAGKGYSSDAKPTLEVALPDGKSFDGKIAFSPGSDRWALTLPSNRIHVYSLSSSAPVLDLALPGPVQELVWGEHRLVASSGRELAFIDTETRVVKTHATSGGTTGSIALDGSSFASVQVGKQWCREEDGTHAMGQDPSHIDRVSLPDFQRVELVKATQGHVILIDEDTWLDRDLYSFVLHDGARTMPKVTVGLAHDAAISPNARWIGFIDGDYNVVVYDVQTGQHGAKIYLDDRPSAMALDAAGTLYVAPKSGGVQVYEQRSIDR